MNKKSLSKLDLSIFEKLTNLFSLFAAFSLITQSADP